MSRKSDPLPYARRIVETLKDVDYGVGCTAIRIAFELRRHYRWNFTPTDYYSTPDSDLTSAAKKLKADLTKARKKR